ncbi:MAG: integrase [Frankiales bacterium]|nr:integrase [Frankiales bacterium]
MAWVEKLPSGKYRGIYRDPAGRQRSRTFMHKLPAVRWAEEQELAVKRGTHRDPSQRALTVREFSVLWLAARDVEDTTAAGDAVRMRGILEEFGDATLDSVTTLAIQGWLKRLGRDRKPATVRKYASLLSTMLTSAVRERLLTENPSRFVELPTVGPGPERFLSRQFHAAVVNELPQPYDVVAYVKAYSALRWGEIAGLHRGAVDALRQTLVVSETLTEVNGVMKMKPYPKGKKPRRAAVPQHVVDALAAFIASSPPSPCGLPGHEAGCSGLLFRNRNGRPLSRHNNRKLVVKARDIARDKAVKALGPTATAAAKAAVRDAFDGFRPHDFRHTGASWLVQDGVPLYEVQAQLGHGSQATTQRYAHLAPGGGERVRAALHNGDVGQDVGQKAKT